MGRKKKEEKIQEKKEFDLNAFLIEQGFQPKK